MQSQKEEEGHDDFVQSLLRRIERLEEQNRQLRIELNKCLIHALEEVQ